MENKIRIERAEEDLYRINIADDGTEIVFDLADISLPIKCDKAFNEVESTKNRAVAQVNAIENKYKNQEMNKKLENQRTHEIYQVYKEMFERNRKTMDDFFGLNGAMDKIFGDTNYIDMYDDLYQALEPHLKQMKINVSKVEERIKKKYSVEENVIK